MRRSIVTSAVLAVALGTGACGSDDTKTVVPDAGTSTTPEVTFEFVSVLGQPGSAEALQALTDLHKSKYAHETMSSKTLDLPTYLELPKRLAAGETPPDVIQWMAPDIPSVQPLLALNDYLAKPAHAELLSSLYPEFVEEVTTDGKIYALPWELIRSNSVIYNKRVFAAHGLTPPTTMAEFLAACRTLKAAGVTPVGGYSLGLLLEDLLAGVMGAQDFCSFVAGSPPDETSVRSAVDVFAEVASNYFDRGTLWYAPETVPNGEVIRLMDDSVAMLFTGDWIPGNLEQMGWTPGVDFGLATPPGTADLFYHGLLVAVVPAGAPHLEAALNFLDTIGSQAGHSGYFKYKDGNSARKDVDLNSFNVERRQYIEDLAKSQRRCSRTREFDVWESPLVNLTATTPIDREAVVKLVLTRGK
jgi:ABC-type glycerol-3-phosphate transport system substrate-binding protein